MVCYCGVNLSRGQREGFVLGRILDSHGSFVGFVSIALVLCSAPVFAAGKAAIDYTADGKTAAAACMAHLAGKAPTTAVSQSGFRTRLNTKRGILYQKNTRGGLLPIYFALGLYQKPKDQTKRRCSFILSLPHMFLLETKSPEFKAVFRAVYSELKSKGYKQTSAKNGRDLFFATPNGTYRLSVIRQTGLVEIILAPK
jgi:hypothetical protein